MAYKQMVIYIILSQIYSCVLQIFIFLLKHKYCNFYVTVSGLNLGGLQVIEGISFAPKEKLEVRLTGLKPGSSYRVFLSASTRAGIGEAIFLDMNTLPAGSKLLILL